MLHARVSSSTHPFALRLAARLQRSGERWGWERLVVSGAALRQMVGDAPRMGQPGWAYRNTPASRAWVQDLRERAGEVGVRLSCAGGRSVSAV